MTSSDLTADLPAPRDDEPSSLRQDIVDELADHLACAVRREELRAYTEPRGLSPWPEGSGGETEPCRSAAYQRVLQRFGDPRTIARKLWWDHMQEKIMAQRITAIMAGIGAAACVAACIVLWQFVQNSHASQTASLAEMRDFNAKLLAGLTRPAEAPAADSEWANVRFKLVDERSGRAVEAVEGTLAGGPIGSDNATHVSLKAAGGTDGTLDFGTVPFGRYGLALISSERGIYHSEEVLVGPDRPQELTIKVPEIQTTALKRIDFDPPDGSNDQLQFLFEIHASGPNADGREWTLLDDQLSFLTDGRGNVLAATVRPIAASRYAGRSVEAYNAGVQHAQSPVAHPQQINVTVLQPLEPDVIPQVLSRYQQSAPTFVGYRLMSFRVPVSAETGPVSGAPGSYRVPLPPEFWQTLSRAEVWARLKPPPDGMQIVSTRIGHQPSFDKPGTHLTVRVSLPRPPVNGFAGPDVLQVIEIAELANVAPIPAPDGGASGWTVSILVTDEQATTLAMAQGVQDAQFIIEGVDRPSLHVSGTDVDAVLRERLQQVIDERDATDQAEDATPPTET